MTRTTKQLGIAGIGLFAWGVLVPGCVPTGDDDDATAAAGFSALYDDYFFECAACHAPDAPGRTDGIEATLDFTDEDTAYTTIATGQASGLVGNQEACNGAYFVGTSPETSLILAVLDEDVRAGFSLDGNPGCDGDAISDMTVKVGYAPSGEFLSNLEAWIEEQNTSVARR